MDIGYKSFKVIDKDLKFQTKGFVDYLNSFRLNPTLTVSIIGTQSGGKSTLLNSLLQFQVFRTMNSSEGYAQTTLGVDLVISKDWFVFDFEGSDSGEREESEELSVQYKFGLLSLIVSDVILINVFANEVSRASANFKILLKVIIENYLKYFEREPKPKNLVFVLRDCQRSQIASTFEEKLEKEVLKIWNSIERPNIPFRNIFNIKIAALHFQREILAENEINELRDLINTFQREDQIRKEELPALLDDLWRRIRADEDLDSILSIKDSIDISKCRRVIQKHMESCQSDFESTKQVASYQFLDIDYIQHKFMTVLEEEIRNKTQFISNRIIDQELRTVMAEICDRFDEIRGVQKVFISLRTNEICRETEEKLLRKDFDVSNVYEFIREAERYPLWRESNCVRLFKDSLSKIVFHVYNLEEDEINTLISNLTAPNEHLVNQEETKIKDIIKQRESALVTLVQSLGELIDFYPRKLTCCSSMLRFKANSIRFSFENSKLQTDVKILGEKRDKLEQDVALANERARKEKQEYERTLRKQREEFEINKENARKMNEEFELEKAHRERQIKIMQEKLNIERERAEEEKRKYKVLEEEHRRSMEFIRNNPVVIRESDDDDGFLGFLGNIVMPLVTTYFFKVPL